MKKPSIYAAAKTAKDWHENRNAGLSGPARFQAIESHLEFDFYAAQNFLRLLRALKREHKKTWWGAHVTSSCPTCKLIKRTEGMK